VAQSVEYLTLGFSSGHDLRVVRLTEPLSWAPHSGGSLLEILSFPLPLALPSPSLSLINKQIFKKILKVS